MPLAAPQALPWVKPGSLGPKRLLLASVITSHLWPSTFPKIPHVTPQPLFTGAGSFPLPYNCTCLSGLSPALGGGERSMQTSSSSPSVSPPPCLLTLSYSHYHLQLLAPRLLLYYQPRPHSVTASPSLCGDVLCLTEQAATLPLLSQCGMCTADYRTIVAQLYSNVFFFFLLQ